MVLSIIIIMFILMGIIIGIKRGFTYQLIKMLSGIVILVLSLLLKNPLANLFIKYFDFLNINKGLSIIFYRGIAFIILCFIFKMLIRLLLKASKKFEKLLSATIILGIPSKILGGVLGFVEYYIYAFIILLILSIPIFKIDVNDSMVARSIIGSTPALSKKVDTDLFAELQEEFDKGNNASEDEYIKILKRHGLIKDIN